MHLTSLQKTYFTSDLHFGHKNIIFYCKRPYFNGRCPTDKDLQLVRKAKLEKKEPPSPTPEDIAKMNRDMVDAWNKVVNPEDKVIVLGDLAMGQMADSLEYVKLLNGTIYLLLGNHDRPSYMQTKKPEKREEWIQKYKDAGIHWIGEGEDHIEVKYLWMWVRVKISHFPYAGDHPDQEGDRFPEARPTDEGGPLMHGHIHNYWKFNGRMMNVGWDIWHKPISFFRLYTQYKIYRFFKVLIGG
jgi:calcineurin-like phosphoesterase family protein